MATVYSPGERVPVSGQYAAALTSSGSSLGREVTCVLGEPFPPTHVGEYGWVLVDRTRH